MVKVLNDWGQAEFPYVEIRTSTGDYWQSIDECLKAGYVIDQVWSVTVEEQKEGTWFCYGPASHYVNLLGYVVTDELHDSNTYFTDWCGRDGADPARPEMTEDEIIDAALNAACAAVQDALGQTDGGGAALFFSPHNSQHQRFAAVLRDYIGFEMQLSRIPTAALSGVVARARADMLHDCNQRTIAAFEAALQAFSAAHGGQQVAP
jgi:hypothetical protein